ILVVCIALAATAGPAQPPKDKKGGPAKGGKGPAMSDTEMVEDIVSRMMSFDKNKDGKLTRDEITDTRLLRLFDRADADKDGVVTKEELTALATALAAEQPPNRGGPGGGFGPGGPGGRGPGGPGGGGGPPQPGPGLA